MKKVHQNLISAEFDSFLPLITTVRLWSSRKKKAYLPLITSYVFLKFYEINLSNILPVTCVSRILKHLGNSAYIKDDKIESLKFCWKI